MRDRGGYLADPEAKYGHIENPDLVRFKAIAHGCGGNPGERTDIHVDAVLKSPDKKRLRFDHRHH